MIHNYSRCNVKETLKNPTGEELNNLQDMLKVKWYWSYKGFGGRYNEPYTFSEPAFSPDGKRIAFSSLYPASDIYIVNVDGSGLKRLTNTKYWEVLPQFSPDGKSIIFISDKDNYGGEYYIIDSDGSNYRRLVPDFFGVSEACFSPDGTYIAFTAQKGLSREVYIMNSDGTNIKQLTNNGNKCSSIKFSHDSKNLFFVQKWYDYESTPALTEEIFSINVDGSEIIQLTRAKKEKAHNEKILDITNNHLFFLHNTYSFDNNSKESNYHEVWQMMTTGNAQKKILGGGMTHGTYYDARILLNGKAIIFVDDIEKPYAYTLNIKEIENSEKILKLSNERICNSKLAVSPDNKFIAYSVLPQIHSRNDGIKNLNIVSIDGKESWSIGVR
jgi:tricorn protease-like protein